MAKDIFSNKDVSGFGRRHGMSHSKHGQKMPRKRREEGSEKKGGKKIFGKILLLLVVVAMMWVAWTEVPGFIDETVTSIKYAPEERAEMAAKGLAEQEIPKLMGAATLEEAVQKGYNAMYSVRGEEEGYWIVDIAYTTKNLDLKKQEYIIIKRRATVRVNASSYEAELPTKWV